MTQSQMTQWLTLCKVGFRLEGKGERELVNLDKVINHEASPGNPPHAAIAIEVHCKESR